MEMPTWVQVAYLVGGVCFILALKGLSGPKTARNGNLLGAAPRADAVVVNAADFEIHHQLDGPCATCFWGADAWVTVASIVSCTFTGSTSQSAETEISLGTAMSSVLMAIAG